MTHGSKELLEGDVAVVRVELDALPSGSAVKQHFRPPRLDQIAEKIRRVRADDLEWGYWQPFFLFVRDAAESALAELDADLLTLAKQSRDDGRALFRFLRDEGETVNPWFAGLFEVYCKAALLRCGDVTLEAFDAPLPNGRECDARIRVVGSIICVECTTLGESDAAKATWREHCEVLKQDPDTAYVRTVDPYSPGRRLYDKVFDKIAPDWDPTRTQCAADSPNILMVGLAPGTSDLSTRTKSIGWGVDNLFALQLTDDDSPISLRGYLSAKLDADTHKIRDVLSALDRLSGVMLFARFRLGTVRVNPNARAPCRLTSEQTDVLACALANPPTYCS